MIPLPHVTGPPMNVAGRPTRLPMAGCCPASFLCSSVRCSGWPSSVSTATASLTCWYRSARIYRWWVTMYLRRRASTFAYVMQTNSWKSLRPRWRLPSPNGRIKLPGGDAALSLCRAGGPSGYPGATQSSPAGREAQSVADRMSCGYRRCPAERRPRPRPVGAAPGRAVPTRRPSERRLPAVLRRCSAAGGWPCCRVYHQAWVLHFISQDLGGHDEILRQRVVAVQRLQLPEQIQQPALHGVRR